jgi:acyl-CoA thioester hydrolase
VRLSYEPPLDPGAYPFAHVVRVRFAETDAMGIVHHAAYLPYLEEARVAYLRAVGHPYVEVRAEGVDFTVLEAFVRYHRPLRFDEEVTVSVVVGTVARASFQLGYLLSVEAEVRASAVTVHGGVDRLGRPVRLPTWLRPLVP